PPRCAACNARVALLNAFCGTCAATAERAAGGWAGNGAAPIAAFLYGGAVARAIMKMKYERRPDIARPLGDLLRRAIEGHAVAGIITAETVVVPVPLHPSRLAERGYNQAALVARRVARGLRAPLWPMALARTNDTPQQTALDRTSRAANVAGAFAARGGGLRGRRVLLIDDVHTTGATLDACAVALRGAGVTAVACAVVARTASS
ncbi:MAG: ComF family protein, partial [Polyangiaceae bacterium]